jgi:hypothetical protein
MMFGATARAAVVAARNENKMYTVPKGVNLNAFISVFGGMFL